MTKPSSLRPLSVKVIVWWYLLSVLLKIPNLQGEIAVFNVHLSGSATIFFGVFLMVLFAWLAFGLWHLQELARRVAIGFESYELLNLALSFTHPVTRALAIDFIRQQQSPEAIGEICALFGRIVIAIAVIWFLIKRKTAFVKPTTTSPI